MSFQDVFLSQFHIFGELDRKDLDSLNDIIRGQDKKLLT